MKRIILISLCVGLVFGCRGTNILSTPNAPPSVCRDIPLSPTFVVLPYNNYQAQISSAEYVEKALVSVGVRVIIAPATKEVETKTSAGGKQSMQGGAISPAGNAALLASGETQASQIRTERYHALDDFNADYIITTNGKYYYYDGMPYIENVSVKIIKKDTGEILSIFETEPDDIEYKLYDVLKAMGINAKKPQ